MLFSSIGFKKYVWFISIGYGFAVAAIGVTLLIAYASSLSMITAATAALTGYLGIIYVMFGGARRLEMRQNRTYGDDPEYQSYVKKTPIMLPLIPLYSVEKYKWLVA